MKVEFNKNSFSANLTKENEIDLINQHLCENEWMKRNKSMLFGILALVVSFATLPFSIFMNLSTEFLTKVFSTSVTHWIIFLFIISTLIIDLSILFGIFSIVFFAKSKKKPSEAIGLSFVIFSFIINVTGLILSIFALSAW